MSDDIFSLCSVLCMCPFWVVFFHGTECFFGGCIFINSPEMVLPVAVYLPDLDFFAWLACCFAITMAETIEITEKSGLEEGFCRSSVPNCC